MAKLVTKFKYLKPSEGRNLGGYVKYIATREGVHMIDDTGKLAPTTMKQKQFIEKLLKDFPDSQEMLEYEDYLKEQTVGNASEYITRVLEDNAYEVMNTKTYADYIATRPRAQRFGSHGLFTDDGVQVKLSKVSEELNLHEGNVWTVIISLRREDAERLGFNDGVRWRDMLRTQTEALATNLKIPMENLKWFAAFHNESHHPHVHMIAYSSKKQEGYLSKKGVYNLRKSFANDIFAQDLLCLFKKQTEYRDELRMESRGKVEEIIAELNQGNYDNPRVEELLLKLADRLSKTNGKKVYGYLKADVKTIVDSIVDELEKDGRVAELYHLWYEQTEEIKRTYTENIDPRVPLSKNKEFKSIRNAVIQEAMHIVSSQYDVDVDDEQKAMADEMTSNIERVEHLMTEGIASEDIVTETIVADSVVAKGRDIANKYGRHDSRNKETWWTDQYKEARSFYYGTKDIPSDYDKAYLLMQEEANKGNGLAMHDLAKMYLQGHGCEKDEELAQEWFEKTYHAFIKEESKASNSDYLRYRIGKLYSFGYGVEQDYLMAAEWYEKALLAFNPFAAYALGSLYHRGQGVQQDDTKAFSLYSMAAKNQRFSNAYAAYELGSMCEKGIGTKQNQEESQYWYVVAYKGFLKIEENMADDKVYYRLGQMNMNGVGTKIDYELAKEYYEKAFELDNLDALYGLGRLYLKKDYEYRDREKAIEYLTQAAEQGHEYARKLLEWLRNNRSPSGMSGMINLMYHMSRIFEDKLAKGHPLERSVDRKLRRQIDEKKQAQGIKQ